MTARQLASLKIEVIFTRLSEALIELAAKPASAITGYPEHSLASLPNHHLYKIMSRAYLRR
ncbi:hypothetical protein AAKU64_004021 [Undibacterium sp. GrIS 1.8]|uniref:hypothetical protein n=1 Tax=unclassified Undibacterium TaxID=2630295 RepID=UPI00339A7910